MLATTLRNAIQKVDNCSGVYLLVNMVRQRGYVGSSENLRRRRNNHWIKLRHDRHDNSHLQKDFDTDTESAFRFFCLEHCAVDKLLTVEQKWLNKLWVTELYNVQREAHARRGKRHQRFGSRHTEKTKEAIRSKRRKQVVKHSPETRARIGEGNRGKKLSMAVRRRISAAKKGQVGWSKGLRGDPRVLRRTDKLRTRVPENHRKLFVEVYLDGDGINTIRLRYGYDWAVVRRTLIEESVKLRTHKEQARITNARTARRITNARTTR